MYSRVKIAIAVCMFTMVGLGVVAQDVVNKGTLYLGHSTTASYIGNFLNEGEYHNNGQASFKRNLVNNGSMSVADTGTTSFEGSTLQQIKGEQPTVFYRVLLANSKSGVDYELSNEMIVRREMVFRNGVVKNGETGSVSFLDGAQAQSASNNSHIWGKVRKTGNQPFTYPVGNEQYYRPAGISAPAAANERITAAYFFRNGSQAPYDPHITNGQVGTVNQQEYWILERENGSTPVNVTLTWNADKTGTVVASLPALLMVRWNGGRWESAGGANAVGNNREGSLRSGNLLSELGPLTFAELLRKALIGLALQAGEPRLEPDMTYSVTYTLILRNLADQALDSIMLSQDLTSTFPYPMQFRRTGRVTATNNLATHDGYDARTDVQLLQQLSRMAPRQQDTVTFTVKVAPEGRYGTFYSNAKVTARAGNTVVTDISNNGVIMPEGADDPTRYNDPTPVTLKAQQLIIPDGFSPNGDGKNDRFVIINPKPNAKISLKMLNRWGDVVFEDEDYKNTWDGRSNRGLRIGDTLPDGTYYYVITVRDNNSATKVQRFVGYVTLMR